MNIFPKPGSIRILHKKYAELQAQAIFNREESIFSHQERQAEQARFDNQ